jgi:hypothetical protein
VSELIEGFDKLSPLLIYGIRVVDGSENVSEVHIQPVRPTCILDILDVYFFPTVEEQILDSIFLLTLKTCIRVLAIEIVGVDRY